MCPLRISNWPSLALRGEFPTFWKFYDELSFDTLPTGGIKQLKDNSEGQVCTLLCLLCVLSTVLPDNLSCALCLPNDAFMEVSTQFWVESSLLTTAHCGSLHWLQSNGQKPLMQRLEPAMPEAMP